MACTRLRHHRRIRPAQLAGESRAKNFDRRTVGAVMKEIALVRLAINPQTGAVDLTAPFVVIPLWLSSRCRR
jgi:hypothetical protein